MSIAIDAENEMVILCFADDGPVFCPGAGFLFPLLVPTVPPQRLPVVIVLTLLSALILPPAVGGSLCHCSG